MADGLQIGRYAVPLPRSRAARIAVGCSLIFFGFLGFLPIVGFWMIPLGLAVLARDVPIARRWHRRLVVWWLRRRNQALRGTHPAPTDPRRMASWRSGYAAACKAVYAGSIPAEASIPPNGQPLPRTDHEPGQRMTVTDYEAARLNMVNSQVRTTDVTDHALLSALLDVPRERFVPADRRFATYIDEDLEIGRAVGLDGPRYLMEPSPFAKMVQLAEIGPGDTVLDIGCATGYSCAVLARLAESVIAVESDEPLADFAREALAELVVDNVAVVSGALEEGYPKEGPYDAIVIEGAVDRVPDAILDQLKEGGRLVTVVGRGHSGRARLFVREDGIVSNRPVFNAAVPILPGFEAPAEFVF